MNSTSSAAAQPKRTLTQWLSYLESIHPSTIDMGLERVEEVAGKLSLDFSSSTVITVAGTNGKGTTCRFIELALLGQNSTVGVYSSPHLIDYRERVRINGELSPEQDYISAFEQVEAARGEVSLTYFEFGTLAALVMMQKEKVDYAILEVGLGGRLDATNIIDADIAVVTSIGLDHQDWLGETREEIAVEKAGIMRKDAVAIIGEPEPPHTLIDYVTRLECKSLWAGCDFTYASEANGWQWQCEHILLTHLAPTSFLYQNVSTALAVLHQLGRLPQEPVLNDLLASATLPGRRQRVACQPDVYLDVGHNPQASGAMKSWLADLQAEQVHFVVGMLKDKAIADTLLPLSIFKGEWYCANLPGPRGADAKFIRSALPADAQHNATCYDTVTDAFASAKKKAQPNDIILVFGSFLTVADVLVLHC
ncbi:bifunctional tetrahydrofolate synthase/dihydrofolate synthase [Alteromonas ponticola]|uniref:Dihydrofolate synthase/folylpolyglutamate synthase n=1 Tax=Alteromonas aquimaris TaxID=2998417 RepID=A0ABT3P6C9_9ALTE|nr:bifunctional tetrahydrofolate synthase/dihydrofolate synthase [Alteromonas aquimaris]MCW8108305.1 bifunctional tetrahydrofolate synthase/dihydrofolate synthase [Alteromonas aquimaris]